MAGFDRGTKRQCLHCSSKFYDLNKDPIICPSCGKTFLISAARPAVARAAEPEAKVEVVEADEAAKSVGAEVISLEDAEDDDDGDDIPDVEDVEVDDELGGDDDDVFLEEDEDDDKIGFEVSDDKDEL